MTTEVVSGVPPTVPPMNRPPVWRWLRSLEHVTLHFHSGGPRGRVSHVRQAISLRDNLTPEERRDVLLHELIHIVRGPVTGGLEAKEEEQVRRTTARYQLPDIEPVGEALAWSGCQLPEAAHDLGVSVLVLKKRLAHLHPAEYRYLTRRLRYLYEEGH